MALARFLQISDLHLGRPFGWLAYERRDERRRDQQRALETAIRQAIERGVNAILIPGDLFDADAADAGALAFAIQAFEMSGCPPVFISPGNHDPSSPTSVCWNSRLLSARGYAWPAHVHVFTEPHWTSRDLPGVPGARIWGRNFCAGVESLERPLVASMLKDVTAPPEGGFDIAVFHGSREGQCPPGQKIAAPFSDEEVEQSPFAYHAVGHYHAPSRFERHVAGSGASAGVRLAYAGSAVSLDVTETGLHGALEVRISYGSGAPFVQVDPIELDHRRVFETEVDVTGAPSGDQIDRRVQKSLDLEGAHEQDFCAVKLKGRMTVGVRYSGPSSELRKLYFHLRVVTQAVQPDYDLDAMRKLEPRTTEDRFARALLEELETTTDHLQRATIQRALYYGLDAFRLREVLPAYEELGE